MNPKKPAFWVRVAFLALLVFAGVQIRRHGGDWLESAERFPWKLDPPLLAASSLALLAGLAFSPEGWVMVCRQRGVDIPRKTLYAVWFGSQLGRYIPGKVWLFAGRIGYLKARGYSLGKSASTLVLELLFSTAAVGVMTFSVWLFHPDIADGRALRWALGAAGAAVALLPLLTPLQKLVFRIRGLDFRPVPLRHALAVTGFYTLTWIVRGIALWLWFRGMGIGEAEPARCLAAAPLSWLAGYIVVLVPGGLGVREAAAALIALPGTLLAPGIVAAGGQRIVMTVMELVLAAATAGRLRRGKKGEGG